MSDARPVLGALAGIAAPVAVEPGPGVDAAVERIVEEISGMAREIETQDEIAQVASISATARSRSSRPGKERTASTSAYWLSTPAASRMCSAVPAFMALAAGEPASVIEPTEDRIRPSWNESGTALALAAVALGGFSGGYLPSALLALGLYTGWHLFQLLRLTRMIRRQHRQQHPRDIHQTRPDHRQRIRHDTERHSPPARGQPAAEKPANHRAVPA